MKKHWMILILAAMLVVALAVPAAAVTPIDTDRACTLTVHYAREGVGFPGLTIEIYRMAEIFEDGTYALWGDFADYPVHIYGITSQTEWRQITSTLVSYVEADQLQPTATALTDDNGIASFENLKTGMYLVRGVRVEQEGNTLVFEDFLVSVPNPDADGVYQYDVAAKPKFSIPQPEQTQHSVLKLWKDSGYEESRPEHVTVDIYKDGQLHSTQILSAENNWSFSWTAEAGSQWHAVERNVAKEYTVTIVTEGSTILITNAREGEVPPPDDTGDGILTVVMLMAASFSGMTVMAGSRRKRMKYEEA